VVGPAAELEQAVTLSATSTVAAAAAKNLRIATPWLVLTLMR
jgi:hypothetical protein